MASLTIPTSVAVDPTTNKVYVADPETSGYRYLIQMGSF